MMKRNPDAVQLSIYDEADTLVSELWFRPRDDYTYKLSDFIMDLESGEKREYTLLVRHYKEIVE